MNEDKMPKSMAVFLLLIFTIGGVGFWGIFNGYDNAVEAAIFVVMCFLVGVAAILVIYLIYEAIRTLVTR